MSDPKRKRSSEKDVQDPRGVETCSVPQVTYRPHPEFPRERNRRPVGQRAPFDEHRLLRRRERELELRAAHRRRHRVPHGRSCARVHPVPASPLYGLGQAERGERRARLHRDRNDSVTALDAITMILAHGGGWLVPSGTELKAFTPLVAGKWMRLDIRLRLGREDDRRRPDPERHGFSVLPISTVGRYPPLQLRIRDRGLRWVSAPLELISACSAPRENARGRREGNPSLPLGA